MDMKKSFINRYQGPRGPHLSCLTSTSMVGTYKDENQRSIHPRVQGGRTRTKKENTCLPRRRDNGILAKRSKELDRRRRDCEITIAYIKNLPGVVFTEGMHKSPGSMRG
jgi:hypothetical protein